MALANVREKTAPNISEGKIRIHVTEPKVYDKGLLIATQVVILDNENHHSSKCSRQ